MPEQIMRIGGTDGQVARGVRTDSQGNLVTTNKEDTEFTFQDKTTVFNNGETLFLSGEKEIKLDVVGTAPSYKVQFQVRGATDSWTTIKGIDIGSLEMTDELTASGTGTKTNILIFDVSGLRAFRARVIAIESNNSETEWVTVRGALLW